MFEPAKMMMDENEYFLRARARHEETLRRCRAQAARMSSLWAAMTGRTLQPDAPEDSAADPEELERIVRPLVESVA